MLIDVMNIQSLYYKRTVIENMHAQCIMLSIHVTHSRGVSINCDYNYNDSVENYYLIILH